MSKKVLVIDDDPTVTALVQARLKAEGLEVFASNRGEHGIEKAKEVMPDVVVLDVDMPDINGYYVMSDIKKVEGLEEVKIIILTSHEENGPIFARKGIKDYLIKPVNFDELLPKLLD